MRQRSILRWLVCVPLAFFGSVRAQSSRPETPAAKQFAAWLAAFNSADPPRLAAYHQEVFPYAAASRDINSPEREVSLSQATGGFEVKQSQGSSPLEFTAVMRERRSAQFARATMRVEATAPHKVVGFDIHPISTPDAFLSAADRSHGAGSLDDARRRTLVDGMARALAAHYVFPAVGQRMATALRDHAQHGDYDQISDGATFARRVTEDLRAVSHDLHLGVGYGPPREPPGPGDARAANFGFGAIERLPRNVAHLVINEFIPRDEVREAVAGFMTQVADAAALIIDLRHNHGGDSETVALVASYLFGSQPVHLEDFVMRDSSKNETSWTLRDVPGKRFGATKPVYVLISKETFSGGEELAYDLQVLHRAKLVGETTGGGANNPELVKLDEWWSMFIPSGRPVNPITKTNWEGVGVKPDIAVAAEVALDEAVRRAEKDVAAKAAAK